MGLGVALISYSNRAIGKDDGKKADGDGVFGCPKCARMDITDLFKQSQFQSEFSPCSRYVATIYTTRIIIRDAEELKPVLTLTAEEALSDLAWSPDSDYILAVGKANERVYLYGVRNTKWTAIIDEQLSGITSARWALDARHVLVTSELELRVTVWSLSGLDVHSILHPKSIDKGIQTRDKSRFMAVAERHDLRDRIGIYDTTKWTCVRHFTVDTLDMQGFSWSPDGNHLAVWETMSDYKLLIYTPDGTNVAPFVAYKTGLGIKTVTWSPTGALIAIGSYDHKVRLLSHLGWVPIYEFVHMERITPIGSTLVYRELDVPAHQQLYTSSFMNAMEEPLAKYEIIPAGVTVNLPMTRVDVSKSDPKQGIGVCAFDPTGTWLVTRSDNQPSTLWIWDVLRLELKAVLSQLSPVRSVKWTPLKEEDSTSRLVFCCGNGNVYMWTVENGAECIEIPAAKFKVSHVTCRPDGASVLLLDKEMFCLGFFVQDSSE
jgi:WD40 repeat protein